MSTYILKGKKPVKCDSMIEWAEWFGKADRSVNKKEKNGVRVSTVFLGIDHQFSGGPPILFETMIFGGEHDGYQCRYETWEKAEYGHSKACFMVVLSYKNTVLNIHNPSTIF